MNFVHLFQRVAHTVNNDVVKPVQRDVLQPTRTAIFNLPHEIAHPFYTPPGEKQGQHVLDTSAERYGYTSSFKNSIKEARPVVTSNIKTIDSQEADGLSLPTKARGPFAPWNGIRLTPGDSNYTLLHEGLHEVFAHQTSGQQQSFTKAVQEVVNDPKQKDVKQFLSDSLSSYKAYGWKGSDSLKDLKDINPQILTEIHSWLPLYYQNANKPLPASLAKHYSQYFNPKKVPEPPIPPSSLPVENNFGVQQPVNGVPLASLRNATFPLYQTNVGNNYLPSYYHPLSGYRIPLRVNESMPLRAVE